MCKDIPRNRLHRKMFGELIAEELHRTLSHIKCTPASVACFGELAGRVARLRSFLGCVGSRSKKNAGKYEYFGTCMRENGTIDCSFVFSPSFAAFFAS